jgi:uncharacterized protein YjdB
VSGIRSSDSADDTTVTVQNEHLLRIVVSPTVVGVPLGAIRRFTATGHFTSGLTQNITQRVEWTSSAPGVANAGNPPGDRSRVVAVAPGTATITAYRDSGFGQATDSNAVTLTVIAPE